MFNASYPKKKIGRGNPYWCCARCGVPDPEINGEIENHSSFCAWRIAMEAELPPKNAKAKTFKIRP